MRSESEVRREGLRPERGVKSEAMRCEERNGERRGVGKGGVMRYMTEDEGRGGHGSVQLTAKAGGISRTKN